jgi:hypothetical protein
MEIIQCKATFNTHLAKITLQNLSSSAPGRSKLVELFGFGRVPLTDLFKKILIDRILNNGATLIILSTPSRSLTCLRRPPPSTAPSHHSSLQRGIPVDAPFAQTRFPAGGNGAGTC